MKAKIHPKWYPKAKATCACGKTFTVGSTQPELQVEVCSACHPFFTGQMRYVDTMGRVEKFEAKRRAAKRKKAPQRKKPEEKKKKEEKTLKEMLEE